MKMSAKELSEQARDLPDIEKLALVDALLAQLDQPDPEIDHAWAREARSRRQAYREGHMEARDYEQIMQGFPRQ